MSFIDTLHRSGHKRERKLFIGENGRFWFYIDGFMEIGADSLRYPDCLRDKEPASFGRKIYGCYMSPQSMWINPCRVQRRVRHD